MHGLCNGVCPSVCPSISVCLSVCPVDRQQQRRAAGLLLSSGECSRYRSLAAGAQAAVAGGVMTRTEVRGSIPRRLAKDRVSMVGLWLELAMSDFSRRRRVSYIRASLSVLPAQGGCPTAVLPSDVGRHNRRRPFLISSQNTANERASVKMR